MNVIGNTFLWYLPGISPLRLAPGNRRQIHRDRSVCRWLDCGTVALRRSSSVYRITSVTGNAPRCPSLASLSVVPTSESAKP